MPDELTFTHIIRTMAFKAEVPRISQRDILFLPWKELRTQKEET